MSEAWVTKTKNKHFQIYWLEEDCVSLKLIFMFSSHFVPFSSSWQMHFSITSSYHTASRSINTTGEKIMTKNREKYLWKSFFLADCLQRRDNYLTQSTRCAKCFLKVSDICRWFKMLSMKIKVTCIWLFQLPCAGTRDTAEAEARRQKGLSASSHSTWSMTRWP